MSHRGGVSFSIPIFAVGYTGWKRAATVLEKLGERPNLAGVLIIDEGIYAGRFPPALDRMTVLGPGALWGFVCNLYDEVSSTVSGLSNPIRYAFDPVDEVARCERQLMPDTPP